MGCYIWGSLTCKKGIPLQKLCLRGSVSFQIHEDFLPHFQKINYQDWDSGYQQVAELRPPMNTAVWLFINSQLKSDYFEPRTGQTAWLVVGYVTRCRFQNNPWDKNTQTHCLSHTQTNTTTIRHTILLLTTKLYGPATAQLTAFPVQSLLAFQFITLATTASSITLEQNTLSGQVTHLIWRFRGHFTALFRFKSGRLKSCRCLCFGNHLGWERYFPSSWIFAQLPPRRATLLFYFIQDDGEHVTKSRVESPKFIILSSSPETLTIVQSGIESWKKLELGKKRK